MATATADRAVPTVDLQVGADAAAVTAELAAVHHVHLRCGALAAARPAVAEALAALHDTVLWVTFNERVVPAGATLLDPFAALEGIDAENAAVVFDADGLDAFDVAARAAVIAAAKDAGRFVRLTRA